MKKNIHLTDVVTTALSGKRFDQVAACLFDSYSRSMITKWIKKCDITVDGCSKKPKDKVFTGEVLSLNTSLEEQNNQTAECMNIEYIYEDDHLLIVNKRAGVVVHPAAGNTTGTLLNGILYSHPDLIKLPRAGIVHRLDKDTTGIMVVAKTLESYTSLVDQLQKREIKRSYVAIVNGLLTGGGTVDKPIGRDPKNRLKMGVVLNAKPSITHYRLKKKFSSHTYLSINLETGRTHQIRTHMSHIRRPITGDSLYGAQPIIPKNANLELITALQKFKRQALHAKTLGFLHPITKEYKEWSINLPEDLANLLQLLEQNTLNNDI